jgi:hypothetical protein
MKVKRIAEYTPLERLVIKEIWGHVKSTPKDGKERTFKGRLLHNNVRYDIYCDFLLINEFFRITKLDVHQADKLVITSEDIKLGAPIYKEIYLN